MPLWYAATSLGRDWAAQDAVSGRLSAVSYPPSALDATTPSQAPAYHALVAIAVLLVDCHALARGNNERSRLTAFVRNRAYRSS